MACSELGVDVPGSRRVDLGLKPAHLLHERIEVGVGIGHLLADLVEPLELADHIGTPHLDVLEHRLRLVEGRLLQEDSHAVPRGETRLSVGRLVQPGHDLQNRGLPCAVGTDHADLRTGVERHGDVIENRLVAHALERVNHLVNVFSHVAPSV